MMKNRARFVGMLLVLLAASFWASSGIFVNGVVAHSDISPINLAFLRELLTFLVLFGAALVVLGIILVSIGRKQKPAKKPN